MGPPAGAAVRAGAPGLAEAARRVTATTLGGAARRGARLSTPGGLGDPLEDASALRTNRLHDFVSGLSRGRVSPTPRRERGQVQDRPLLRDGL